MQLFVPLAACAAVQAEKPGIGNVGVGKPVLSAPGTEVVHTAVSAFTLSKPLGKAEEIAGVACPSALMASA